MTEKIDKRRLGKDALIIAGVALAGVAMIAVAENAGGFLLGWAYLLSLLGRGVLAAATLTAVLYVGDSFLKADSGDS